MAAELRLCPACGAPIELATPDAEPFPCRFCEWAPPAEGFPTADLETESPYNAETLPLPKQEAVSLGLEVEPEPAESETQEAVSLGLEVEPEPAESEAQEADRLTVAESGVGPEPGAAKSPVAREDGPAHFRQLTSSTEQLESSEELLEQVPEELREVLAARLKSAEKPQPKRLREDTVESLKARGYHVTEDARGTRITGGSSRSTDLSPFEMVRMAAEQDGGVQPRASLPICPECKAASPAGETRCQWCGADLPQD